MFKVGCALYYSMAKLCTVLFYGQIVHCTILWPNCVLYYSMAKLCTVLFYGQIGHGIVQCTTDLEHLYRIYSIPTHDIHQWLLLEFIVLLMMDAKVVRNMYSIPVVVNKHSTLRVASSWFIIYYRLVMHRNSNIKNIVLVYLTSQQSNKVLMLLKWTREGTYRPKHII